VQRLSRSRRRMRYPEGLSRSRRRIRCPEATPSRPRAPTVPTRGLASLRQRFVDRGGDQFACVGNHIATKVGHPTRVCADAWAESGGRRGIHSQQSPAETGVRFTHQAPAIAFDATQRSGSSANEEGRGGRGRATAAPWSDTQASFPFEAAGPGCCECPTGELRRQQGQAPARERETAGAREAAQLQKTRCQSALSGN
jgi:hypothetical protein